MKHGYKQVTMNPKQMVSMVRKFLDLKATNLKQQTLRLFAVGSAVVAALILLVDLHGLVAEDQPSTATCAKLVERQTSLSTLELAQFLTIPERVQQQRVRAILQSPYCLLPELEVRSGVRALREAYPLDFDPNNWLVVLYEGEEYAGYRIGPR